MERIRSSLKEASYSRTPCCMICGRRLCHRLLKSSVNARAGDEQLQLGSVSPEAKDLDRSG